VALVFKLFDALQDIFDRFVLVIKIDAVFFRLVNNIAAAGQVRDEHALAVADELGIDVLIGLAVLENARDVHAALVRERAVAHVRLMLVGAQIRQLVEEMRRVAQLLELLVLDAVLAHLELEIGNDRAEIQVAATLADAVDRPLHLARAHLDRRERIGDRELAVVVAVDAERRRDHSRERRDSRANLARQPAAVGVAEHDPVGAAVLRGLEAVERVLGVRAKAVEKMLRVEDNFFDPLLHVGNRIRDDLQVRFQTDAEIFANVEVPRLTDERDRRSLGFDQRLEAQVLRRFGRRLACHAERRDLGVAELEPFDSLEELRVARVRSRKAAFDVVDADLVELRGDAQLVFQRKGDVFRLAAVAQRRIVDENVLFSGGHNAAWFSINSWCRALTAFSICFSSITTDTLISEVEIISMLMRSRDKTLNMRAATPACVRMPTPMIDTFAIFESTVMPLA